MGESFLVNVNCSTVLGDSDLPYYTMFIDTSKMSIVYELVEWIRWMFSLETCFYITHNSSVIHELEDIQLLSRLKNFELMPCGGTSCVHKKLYRVLLKNLSLFVHWNGLEVPKYFLHKLNQMTQKFTQENNIPSLMIHTSKQSQTQLEISDQNGPKWLQKFREFNDKKFDRAKNIEINDADSKNSIVEDTKRIKGSIINVSPVKNKLKTVQESSKNCKKPNSKKFVKPFSLGEILSNLREEIEKQKTETKMTKCSSPKPSSEVFNEPDFDMKVTTMETSIEPEVKTSGGKKRKRTRKRKSKKEKELISQFLDTSTTNCSFDIPQSSCNVKPNHIRFDSDEEDNLMETEYVEENPKNETKCDSVTEEFNKCNGFLESKPEESVPMITDNKEIFSTVSSAENEISVSDQIVAEEKLIDLDSQPCDNLNHSYSANGNFKSEIVNPDLDKLLSLKEKFKNGVVIERFY